MSGHRAERLKERIREELAVMFEREIQDPRLTNANITRVEVSSDLRDARVFVSAREIEDESREMMDALARASGYLRRRLAENLDLRLTPELRFVLDHSIARGEQFLRLLDQVQAEQPQKAAKRSKPKR